MVWQPHQINIFLIKCHSTRHTCHSTMARSIVHSMSRFKPWNLTLFLRQDVWHPEREILKAHLCARLSWLTSRLPCKHGPIFAINLIAQHWLNRTAVCNSRAPPAPNTRLQTTETLSNNVCRRVITPGLLIAQQSATSVLQLELMLTYTHV